MLWTLKCYKFHTSFIYLFIYESNFDLWIYEPHFCQKSSQFFDNLKHFLCESQDTIFYIQIFSRLRTTGLGHAMVQKEVSVTVSACQTQWLQFFTKCIKHNHAHIKWHRPIIVRCSPAWDVEGARRLVTEYIGWLMRIVCCQPACAC